MMEDNEAIIEFDLTEELQAMGCECAYSMDGRPAKEFYVKVKGPVDSRILVIAEHYGYHFTNKVMLGRPPRRRNLDLFDVRLIFEYDPSRPKGRWRKRNNQEKLTFQAYG